MHPRTPAGPMHRKFIKRLSAVTAVTLAAVLSACSGPAAADTPVSRSGLFFDTVVTITLYDYEGSSGPILDECMSMCEHYESLLSPTVEGSDIWRINHSDTGPVAVDTETAELLQTAIRYSEMSDGVLDLTIGGLCDLWDIDNLADTGTPVIPAQKDITEALTHIDHGCVTVDDRKVTLSDPEACITLGFIAKGYVADRLEDELRSLGVKSAMIDLGGNIEVIGRRPYGGDFRVGIQKPFAGRGESIAVTPVADGMSVVSSGTYERYFTVDGRIYHHILDTKTGYPADTGVIGVTVISDSSVEADALSTLCLLLGTDRGMDLIESLEDTEALFITSDYDLMSSSGWKELTP